MSAACAGVKEVIFHSILRSKDFISQGINISNGRLLDESLDDGFVHDVPYPVHEHVHITHECRVIGIEVLILSPRQLYLYLLQGIG